MPPSDLIALVIAIVIIVGSVVFALRISSGWKQIPDQFSTYWSRSAILMPLVVILAAVGIFGPALIPTPWKSLLLTCAQGAALVLAVAFVIFPWAPPIRGRIRWKIAWITFALLACGTWIVLSRKGELTHVPPWLIFLMVIAFAACYQFWQFRRSVK